MTPPSALTGIRIVDFSHVYQGPVGTQLLADYGADVIKVERPDAGDWSRRWGPFVGGVSLPYAGLNRNKRSFALNVKGPGGRAAITPPILMAIEACALWPYRTASSCMKVAMGLKSSMVRLRR